MSCDVMSCSVVLCCAMLCYVMLRRFTLRYVYIFYMHVYLCMHTYVYSVVLRTLAKMIKNAILQPLINKTKNHVSRTV